MSINVPGGASGAPGGAVTGLTDKVANAAEKIPLVGGLLSGITRGIGGLAGGGLSKIFGG